MNDQLIKLIEYCLIDGILTDKERKVIFKKSEEFGISQDECEVILDSMMFKLNINSVAPFRLYNDRGIMTEEGFIKNGIRIGDYTLFYDSGERMESGIYQNGLKEGNYLRYSTDGEIIGKGNYYKGEKHGEIIKNFTKYSGGGVHKKGTFINGKKDGNHFFYGSNGWLVEKTTWNKGDLIRKETFDYYISRTKLVQSIEICEGEHSRTIIKYTKNGKVDYKTSYYNRKKIKTESWNEEGQLKHIAIYRYINKHLSYQDFKSYYDNGQLSLSFSSRRDGETGYIRNGPTKQFFSTGVVWADGFYENGKFKGYRIIHFIDGKRNRRILDGPLYEHEIKELSSLKLNDLKNLNGFFKEKIDEITPHKKLIEMDNFLKKLDL